MHPINIVLIQFDPEAKIKGQQITEDVYMSPL